MTFILFHFDCEITLESVPETNRYQAMSVTVPCIMKQQKAFDGVRIYGYESLPTVPRRSSNVAITIVVFDSTLLCILFVFLTLSSVYTFSVIIYKKTWFFLQTVTKGMRI